MEPKAVVTRVTKTSIEKPKPPVVEAPKERPRLEIVRPAPKVQQKEEERPASRPVVRQHENKIPDIASLTRKNFGKNPAKEEAKNEDKKDTKQGQKGKPAAEAPKTPIKRHIISPDMYANQDFRNKKKKRKIKSDFSFASSCYQNGDTETICSLLNMLSTSFGSFPE